MIPYLLKNLRPIQKQAMSVNHAFYHAPNGSGKKVAALLPFLAGNKLDTLLVMTPTRVQAHATVTLLNSLGINQVRLEASTATDSSSMNNGVIVGTPGRLYALWKEGVLNVDNFRRVLVTEADLMLTSDKVTNLLKALPKETVKTFSSNGFDSITREKVDSVMDGQKLDVITCDHHRYDKGVCHCIEIVDSNKVTGRVLKSIIEHIEFWDDRKKTVIFVDSKADACILACDPYLSKFFFLHSDLSPSNRRQIIFQFRQRNDNSVIVTEDYTARGLDFLDVGMVIHWGITPNKHTFDKRISIMRAQPGDKCTSLIIASDPSEIDQIQFRLGIRIDKTISGISDLTVYRKSVISRLKEIVQTNRPSPAARYATIAHNLLSRHDFSQVVTCLLVKLESKGIKERPVSLLAGLPDYKTILLHDPTLKILSDRSKVKRFVGDLVKLKHQEKGTFGRIELSRRGWLIDVPVKYVKSLFQFKNDAYNGIRPMIISTLPEIILQEPSYRKAVIVRDREHALQRHHKTFTLR